uniref:Uncharacterized protein n=1 Tax=Populus trichocarpa TaxID=3694 RepID=B9H426_POPTR
MNTSSAGEVLGKCKGLMVVNQIRQMAEDNQQLLYLKNKVVEEQLEEFSGIVNEKLRKTEEENRIVRLRTQMHHEQNKEEGYDLIKEYAEKLTAMKRRKLEIESLMLDEPAL